jgi:predicted alpha/beta-fold hydrolase
MPTVLPSPTRQRHYRPAWWLPDPHSATLWGRVGRREPAAAVDLLHWETPDNDFLQIARLTSTTTSDPSAPRLLLLHGLEGGVHSHYVRAMFREARTRGWGADLLLFRTCGSLPNRLPRSYHSGETSDPAFVIDRIIAEFPNAPLGVLGVSLGGNVLCKLLGELGNRLPAQLAGAVAMSVPYDLARASRQIGRGFGTVYERAFLRSLIPKALAKIARHAELAPLASVTQARTLWEFDDHFTAPLHGFDSAADYYARASALGYLQHIRARVLLLSAEDDPFLPPSVLNDVRHIAMHNDALELEFVARGGHVGFTAGRWPWNPWYYGEWRAAEFLDTCFTSCLASRTRPHPINPIDALL